MQELPWQSRLFKFQQLMTALKETLKYPRLLLDKPLHNTFIESLLVALRGVDHGVEDIIEEKLPGAYLLLVHPDNQVRQ